MAQVYDKDGTTNFQFTFIDKKTEWHVFFTQGFISITNVSTDMRIKVNFPEEEHWTYEDESDDSCTTGKCQANDFTLTITAVRVLNDGWLELHTKCSTIRMMIPYLLALNLMKFMFGSTDLERVCGVIKK